MAANSVSEVEIAKIPRFSIEIPKSYQKTSKTTKKTCVHPRENHKKVKNHSLFELCQKINKN